MKIFILQNGNDFKKTKKIAHCTSKLPIRNFIITTYTLFFGEVGKVGVDGF